MKFWKRASVLVLAGALVFSSAACGSGSEEEGGEEINEYMSQIYVSNYNGGFGTEWLYAIKDRFQEQYKDYSFEENKKGVQVIISSDKEGYYGTGLYNGMGGNRNEVFFTQSISYFDFINSGFVLDITDVVNDSDNTYNALDANKDSKTILSKMSEEQINYLKTGNKFYAVPHYLGLNGITYDIDLFNNKRLYFAKNGAPSEAGYAGQYEYTNLAGDKSAGPDGRYETYDDGLPATYDEFFTLCAYMNTQKGVKPFTITGQYKDTYAANLLAALSVDYEGLAQSMLNFTFSGTAENLITLSGNEITPRGNVPINNETGYETYSQAGKYYALKFLEGVSNYFDNSSLSDEDSHVAAQTRYLRSRYNNAPIAFLIEGNWWENEASATFEQMGKDDESYSKMNRRLGFMPFPKATSDKITSPITLLDGNYSFAFINGNIKQEKINLAKTFLKFCYTDYSLEEYTATTGTVKALKYSISDPTKQKMSTFGNSVWNLVGDDNTKVVYQYSQNRLFIENQNDLRLDQRFKGSSGSGAFSEIVKSKKSAAELFNDIVNKNDSSYWTTTYGKYFNN